MPFLLLETSSQPPGEEQSTQTTQTYQGSWLTRGSSWRGTASPRSPRFAGAREGRDILVYVSIRPSATLWHSRPILRCVFAVFFTTDLSGFLTSLFIHCWSLSCACIPKATWLLVAAMFRLRSGCYGGYVRLGGFSWPAWASPPSCFGDFPRDLGVPCFTCVFLLSCLIQFCLVVSGYGAPRPAYGVLFPWFQAVLRTLINQGMAQPRGSRLMKVFDFWAEYYCAFP